MVVVLLQKKIESNYLFLHGWRSGKNPSSCRQNYQDSRRELGHLRNGWWYVYGPDTDKNENAFVLVVIMNDVAHLLYQRQKYVYYIIMIQHRESIIYPEFFTSQKKLKKKHRTYPPHLPQLSSWYNPTPNSRARFSHLNSCHVSPVLASGLSLDPAPGRDQKISLAKIVDQVTVGRVKKNRGFFGFQSVKIYRCARCQRCCTKDVF